MRGISISLETIKTGLRATGRIDGRSVAYFEGNDGGQLVRQALASVAGAHCMGGDRYDLTYVDMNDAARLAYAA